MKPGDAFICNDPYLAGGSHLPDISIITPVHHEGVVRFFCGNIAHHADVGGRMPGLHSGTSRSIFEEGIRLPVIRIAREGEIDRDLIELIAHNTRDPEERILDLQTQIGSNARGGRHAAPAREAHDLAGSGDARSTTSSPTPSAACARASPNFPTASTGSSARSTMTASRGRLCPSSARPASRRKTRARLRGVRPAGARCREPAGQRPEGDRSIIA